MRKAGNTRTRKREVVGKRLILIDGHSVLFRAFHAYPPLTTSRGELVNAVYGFTNILFGVIKELEPTHFCVSFDREAPTFRHEEYEGYKAHRPEAPEELVRQQDRVEEVVSVLNIPIFAVEGFEADDVLGTLAKQAVRKGLVVIIVTGDQDAFQLVRDPSASSRKKSGRVGKGQVLVYTPTRGKQQAKFWDEKAVVEKFALQPEQLVDLKALAGDSSDAIPGVRGIGPKTATVLLQEYQDLESVYRNLDKIAEKYGKVTYQKLVDGKVSAKLSKKLAVIVDDVPIKLSLKKCAIHDYDKAKAIGKLQELEFTSLIEKLPNDGFEQMVQETFLGD